MTDADATPEDAALAVLGLVEEKLNELLAVKVEIRELITDLHGATRDARVAKRELMAAIATLDGGIEKHIAGEVDKGTQRLKESLKKSDEYILERAEKAGNDLRDAVGHYLGAGSQQELLTIVIAGLAESIKPTMINTVERNLNKNLAGIVRKELGLGPSPMTHAEPLTADQEITAFISRMGVTEKDIIVTPQPKQQHSRKRKKEG